MRYLTSRDSKQGNIISLMGSIAFPVILGAVTFGLKKLIAKWLGKGPHRDQPTRRDLNNRHDQGLEFLQE